MSASSLYVEDESKTALEDAQRRLQEFEKLADSRHRMARFRRESPRHPILLGMFLTAASSLLLVAAGVVLALAPLVSGDLARTFAQTPVLSVLPIAMVGFAMCSGVLWVALRFLASARAAKSPLLPKDLAEQNRLRSDVLRLKAQRDVNKRLSATPAPSRVRSNFQR